MDGAPSFRLELLCAWRATIARRGWRTLLRCAAATVFSQVFLVAELGIVDEILLHVVVRPMPAADLAQARPGVLLPPVEVSGRRAGGSARRSRKGPKPCRSGLCRSRRGSPAASRRTSCPSANCRRAIRMIGSLRLAQSHTERENADLGCRIHELEQALSGEKEAMSVALARIDARQQVGGEAGFGRLHRLNIDPHPADARRACCRAHPDRHQRCRDFPAGGAWRRACTHCRGRRRWAGRTRSARIRAAVPGRDSPRAARAGAHSEASRPPRHGDSGPPARIYGNGHRNSAAAR
jgi:hypothetical protein